MFVNSSATWLEQQLTKLSQRQWLLAWLVFAGVIIFTGIGLRSPWPADEPRFAEIAREMVDTGQWLIPMRGGEYYPDKPPVFMWTIALFYWVTGNLKVAFLLPSALCGLITLAAVYDLGCRLWSKRIAVNSVFLLLLAPQFLLQAKTAQIDGMVACWITLSCYGLLRHFLDGPSWGWYFFAWAFMGLGIITKGVGFLPILMLPLLFFVYRQPNANLSPAPRWPLALGPLIMLAVIALWLIPMLLFVNKVHTPEIIAYRDNILFRQTGERYLNSWGHIKPWYYFIVNVIPVLWFPLPFLLLASLGSLRKKVTTRPDVWVILLWVLLVVIFFSLSPGKRGVYVLPALPMFALAVAAITDNHRLASWLKPLVTSVHWAIGFLLISIGIIAWNELPLLANKIAQYTQDISDLHTAGTFFVSIGILWIAAWIVFFKQSVFIRFFAGLMAVWLLYSTWGYILLEPLRTPRNVLVATEAQLPADASLGIIDFSEQYILFSRLDVTHFGFGTSFQDDERNAWLWMTEGNNRYVLVEADKALECFDVKGATDVGVAHRRRWLLIGTEQRVDHCPPPSSRRQFITRNPGHWLEE